MHKLYYQFLCDFMNIKYVLCFFFSYCSLSRSSSSSSDDLNGYNSYVGITKVGSLDVSNKPEMVLKILGQLFSGQLAKNCLPKILLLKEIISHLLWVVKKIDNEVFRTVHK